jgi:hypothetical protein
VACLLLGAGVVTVALYFRWARTGSAREREHSSPRAISTSHCGAGCALADLLVERLAFAIPGIAIAGGLGSMFTDRIFAIWVLDFIVAFLLGIGFQCAAIASVRGLGARAGIIAVIKADGASITARQLGMYAVMATIQLALLPALFDGRASVATSEFWFAMQLSMLAGVAVAYPVNAILIRQGIQGVHVNPSHAATHE